MVDCLRERDVRQVVKAYHHERRRAGNALLSASLRLPVAAPSTGLPTLVKLEPLSSTNGLYGDNPTPCSPNPWSTTCESCSIALS